ERFHRVRVGVDLGGGQQGERLGAEGGDLLLLGVQPQVFPSCRHLQEEVTSSRLADGAGHEPLSRSQISHRQAPSLPVVFTANTAGGPSGGSSITLTDVGEMTIRWNRSSGWPR